MALPGWIVGRHLTSCTITPITIDADGAVAEGTGVEMTQYFVVEEIEVNVTRTTENVTTLASFVDSEVVLEQDSTLTIHEVMRKGNSTTVTTATGSILPKVFSEGHYARLEFTHGSNQWTITGVMSDYTEGGRRGKNVCSMTIRQISEADANGAIFDSAARAAADA
jgi:hypothetical protein